MAYFRTRDLAGITIFAALWGVLNVTVSPIFFQIFSLPFLCDVIGFSALILAVWWVRKLGTATFVGFIALIINMLVRPTALHFFGFFTVSIVFDVLTFLIGYNRLFEKRLLGSTSLFAISVFSAAVAGLIIGSFFMPPVALAKWGGVLSWAGLHAVGGVIGGAVGVSLMNALTVRGIASKIGASKRI
ncbi:MAG: hypothetical protein OEY24_05295 [Candidatus Bathyarchaeota archaeon]|nr:hypothetical protein [Candidatus Bathyarchaeota archaeon]MDH5495098.1 hypothetical protein [Candidatus Bathyarchaeota archaeon]